MNNIIMRQLIESVLLSEDYEDRVQLMIKTINDQ